jgi:hypothetical protein
MDLVTRIEIRTQRTLLLLGKDPLEPIPERRELTLELHRQRIKGDRYLEMKIQTRPGQKSKDAERIELKSMTLQVAPLGSPQKGKDH